jgi:hypothetical protein
MPPNSLVIWRKQGPTIRGWLSSLTRQKATDPRLNRQNGFSIRVEDRNAIRLRTPTQLQLQERRFSAMARFLIEVPHDAEPGECARAVQFFLRSGSHFMTHADWGCMDGVHKAFIVVEVDTKEEAMSVVPPVFRPHANIVELNKFTTEEIEELLRRHPGKKE